MCDPVEELCDQAAASCHNPDRAGESARVLILHNTCGPTDGNPVGMATGEADAQGRAAAAYLLSNDRCVSAHYLIGPEASGSGERAAIYHLVHESATAYHAGGNPPLYPSNWQDPTDARRFTGYGLNLVSIGVEVFGQANEAIGPRQEAAIRYLLRGYAGPGGDQGAGIFGRHPGLADGLHIVSHKQVEPGDRWDGANWLPLAQAIAAGK